MTQAEENPRRAGIRRAVQTTCIAVRSDRFKLFGQRGFDVSVDAMLVETRVPMSLGDRVMVTFQTPRGGWVQSRAEVARIVSGRRPGDSGCAVGLRFVEMDPKLKLELQASLRGIPPTIPTRALRVASRAMALAA